jgi:hypothetical protein
VTARLPRRLEALLPALRVAGFVAALGIVVAMAVVAARDASLRDVRWWLLLPAAGGALAWWLLLARAWALLLRGRVTRHDVGGWTRTQALRYLPGGIWAPASRLVTVRGPAADRLATVGAENVLALCAALAIGGTALALAGRPVWLLAVLAAAAPVLAAGRLARVSRVDRARSLRAAATYLAAFAAYVAFAVLVQAAVSGWHRPLAVAGGAALAWAAGLVVVITPGGVGTRELAYAALLSSELAQADAAAGAVLMRLVTIAAELAILVALGRPRTEPEAAPDGGSAPT